MKDYLKDNILIFDGAMGTYFSQVNDDPMYKCEYANITSPNTIKEIHHRYLKAGAGAIKTNTFSLDVLDANFTYKEIIENAYKLALECGKDYNAFVFCNIGTVSEKNDFEDYKLVVDEFIKLGAKNFSFETFSQVEILNDIAKYIKEKNPNAFIICSFAINPDGFSKTGEMASKLLEKANDSIDAVGFNCVCGPLHMLNHLKNLEYSEKPLSISPNASYPVVIGNRVRYESNPHYFAKQIMESIKHGAKIVGGCCGTTPEFIKAIYDEVAETTIEANINSVKNKEKPLQSINKSSFYEKLRLNEKPIAVELDPPVDTDIDVFIKGAKLLKNQGVDIITIADCPVARVRMDSSLLACKLKRELAIDAMPHMTCRDRNINAAKALLLGLNMEKITDVLIVTGDPIPTNLRDEVKTVYEFNSRMLINHINGLNQTAFTSPFYLYAALNINARNFDIQLKFAKQKVENGAVAFLTQPVLSKEAFENLKKAKKELNVPIVAGIMPIVSYRNALFINNEIPGINVCDEIVQLYKDKDKDECSKLAVKISTKVAKEIYNITDGYYLITPFSRTDIIAEIVENIKKM